jgi:hypothetical protein
LIGVERFVFGVIPCGREGDARIGDGEIPAEELRIIVCWIDLLT